MVTESERGKWGWNIGNLGGRCMGWVGESGRDFWEFGPLQFIYGGPDRPGNHS